MLVCDSIGCDSKPVRVVKIGGVVHDYCLWCRRFYSRVAALRDRGFDRDLAFTLAGRRGEPPACFGPWPLKVPVVRGLLRAEGQQPGPGLLQDALPASGLADAEAPS